MGVQPDAAGRQRTTEVPQVPAECGCMLFCLVAPTGAMSRNCITQDFAQRICVRVCKIGSSRYFAKLKTNLAPEEEEEFYIVLSYDENRQVVVREAFLV